MCDAISAPRRSAEAVTIPAISESVAARLADDTVVCRQWAEQELGPYHLDQSPFRRDITEGCRGVALVVGLALAAADGSPLTTTTVEIWHCDAAGRYSGYPLPESVSSEGAATPEYVANRTFLRGAQESNADGLAEFHTIYPGWYPGRTVHIHVIARPSGRTFTSQLYFPDQLTDEVFARPPYRERPRRDTTNATDVIFPTGGEPAVLDVVATEAGYVGVARLHLPIHR